MFIIIYNIYYFCHYYVFSCRKPTKFVVGTFMSSSKEICWLPVQNSKSTPMPVEVAG